MKTRNERIIDYLKNVDSSTEKYTIIEYFYLMEEKFGIAIPPQRERLQICKDIGMSIYRQDLETHESIDSDGVHTNIYPEYILAKEFFKELL